MPPVAIRDWTRRHAATPSRRANHDPSAAVATTTATVGQNPSAPPTRTSSTRSSSGTATNNRNRRPSTGGRGRFGGNAAAPTPRARPGPPPPCRQPRLLALVLLATAASAAAQPVAPEVSALSDALAADQRAHLWRVGAWGLANAVGGAALALAFRPRGPAGAVGVRGPVGRVGRGQRRDRGRRAGRAGRARGAASWAAALAAENGYADVLLVNLGLNVGYAAVGGTLLAVAGRGVSNPAAWRGHGAALVLQGAGLFVLDLVAYLGTRGRLDALVEVASRAQLGASAEGVRLVVGL